MNKSKKNLFIATTLASFFSGFAVSGDTPWAYSGASGPEHWGALNDKFATCSTGKNQSPINLTRMIEGDLPELKVSYKTGGSEVVNNGHTIQVNYAAGSSMTVAGRRFALKQFHFHAPSENTIEAQSYPMEAHFVHADDNGNLSVVAVMYNAGKHNAELEKAWSHMPSKAGKNNKLAAQIDANNLLPENRDYYRFNGSLTTPPCSEGVNWFVMKNISMASQKQIDQFTGVVHHANNRPVQPVNAREIIQ